MDFGRRKEFRESLLLPPSSEPVELPEAQPVRGLAALSLLLLMSFEASCRSMRRRRP